MAISPSDEPLRRHRSDAALNLDRILEAATRLLADDPAASMENIAKAAGVARATAYRHFASRRELVDAARQHAADAATVGHGDHSIASRDLLEAAPGQLSITDVLDKVPPHHLGEQIVAEAQRLPGVTAAALYLVDLDGRELCRLAGAENFPAGIDVPLAIGPEIPPEGIAALRETIDQLLPGIAAAPLFLRGRAIGVLIALGTADGALTALAGMAAIALGLAGEYTDRIDTARRAHPMSPAAELQQNLLPPRIARIGGAVVAGNVLPGYDIGGDWFDYADNADQAWLGICDAVGTGPRAAGLAAVVLGAFRSARHQQLDLAQTVLLMDRALRDMQIPDATAAVTLASWNAPTNTITWLCCGYPAPVIIASDGQDRTLDEHIYPLLGGRERISHPVIGKERILPGERLLLVSDGITDRITQAGTPLGIKGVLAAAVQAPADSAPATVRAVEDAVRDASAKPLADDATLIVLVPTAPAVA